MGFAARASHPKTSSGRRSLYVTCGAFEIHVSAWGAADAPAVMMWHGLARTGRDFDPVAEALSSRYRIFCPDQIGRGLSQWSETPERDYQLSRYVEIAEALADALGLRRFAWVGTSMGGATGMRAAATRLKGRIERLLINDIGPTLPAPAVARIRDYAGAPPSFARMSEFEAMIRQIYQPFGEHSDAQWRHLAETSARRLPDGRITAHYDPRIVAQFENHPADYDLWELYDSLTLPTLALHGVESDLLLADIATAMSQRGPRAEIVEIEGCGHAPGLNNDHQIAIVARFLDAGADT